MTPPLPSILRYCKSQEDLEQILGENRKVVVLYFSYAMPWGKIAEHKMFVCAKAIEDGNINSIQMVMVDYAEFYEFGEKVETSPTAVIRYTSYVDGNERDSTGNSAELEGLVTSLL